MIHEAEEKKRDAASFTITAALRARRFRKLLQNNALTGHDPALEVSPSHIIREERVVNCSLQHLRVCVVRRIAGVQHQNMEDNVMKVCNWYRKVNLAFASPPLLLRVILFAGFLA